LLLQARQEIGEEPATAALVAALAEEFRGLRQRLFLLLSFRYDARALLRAAEHLERGAATQQALAIETLDVTLAGAEKSIVLPLVDESKSLAQRQAALRQRISVPSLDRTARLSEILSNPTIWSLSWTRACAIYVAGKLGLCELTGAVQQALADEDLVIQETALWALTRLQRAGDQEPATLHTLAPGPVPATALGAVG
jgi:hypothetical protein